MKTTCALTGSCLAAAVVFFSSIFAQAADKNEAGGWPKAYTIMAEVASSEHAIDEARERLEAAVTAEQFYKAMAGVVRLYERDTGTNIYILRNYHLIRASTALKDAYIRPLVQIADEAALQFHQIVEATALSSKITSRQFAQEKQTEFRDYTLTLTMLAYALAEAPAGSPEENEIRGAFRTTSEDFFRSLRTSLSFTSTSVEAVLQTLKPLFARLIPERRSRETFVLGLKDARKNLSPLSPLLPNRRFGLPSNSAFGWIIYGGVAGLANLSAWQMGAGSSTPGFWYVAANGGLLYLLGRDGVLRSVLEIRSQARDFKRSEKTLSEFAAETEHQLKPPAPPPTAADISTALLQRASDSSKKMIAAHQCESLFKSVK